MTTVEVKVSGRKYLKMTVSESFEVVEFSSKGNYSFLLRAQELKKKLPQKPSFQLLLSEFSDESLLAEAILKLFQRWDPPYKETELCHCRGVLTQTVIEAIHSGCLTAQSVTDATTASSQCGTCRPDVEKMIDYFLKCNGE